MVFTCQELDKKDITEVKGMASPPPPVTIAARLALVVPMVFSAPTCFFPIEMASKCGLFDWKKNLFRAFPMSLDEDIQILSTLVKTKR